MDPNSLFLEYFRRIFLSILLNFLELLRDLWPAIEPLLSLTILIFAIVAVVFFPFFENISKELLEVVVIFVIIYILLLINANSFPVFKDHWLTMDFENAHLM